MKKLLPIAAVAVLNLGAAAPVAAMTPKQAGMGEGWEWCEDIFKTMPGNEQCRVRGDYTYYQGLASVDGFRVFAQQHQQGTLGLRVARERREYEQSVRKQQLDNQRRYDRWPNSGYGRRSR